ncbi:MAG: hypothetical protein V2A62_04195 [Candidatus Woesearchaeota archaeon]
MYEKFKKLAVHHQIIWSLIIATALVSIWRGIWGLMDKFIFPNDLLISSITTLLLGVGIFAITHYKLK